MRAPVLRLGLDEMIIDNFAGGGGASTGIERALGRSPDIAVNHDPEAVAMHAANHPATRHLCGSVWDVEPKKVTAGRKVGLAWFSPDCTYFSNARGAKPFRDPESARGRRGLAGVIIKWAAQVKPRVILMENVLEWLGWGPLGDDGLPDPDRRGLSFRIWLGKLKAQGYEVQWRELRACDFGAPTTRKRLFLIARCDGQPIVWPTPTHGRGWLPYRTAAECIDWTHALPSIFDRQKPLVEATLRRIGRGVQKYALDAVDPYVVRTNGRDAVPTLIQTGYGEREGQAPRVPGLDKPLGTAVAGGVKHAVVAAFIARNFGGNYNGAGTSLTLPLPTITCQDHHSLVGLNLGTASPEWVRSFLTQYNGQSVGQGVQLPLGTVTTRDRFGLVYVHGVEHSITDIGMRMLRARELFRAQGFDDSYIIDPVINGKPLSHDAQVRMVGNSVSPNVAAAIVRANVTQSSSSQVAA
jgi:DNA (cytosine-5)-methyltransferase 1